VDERDAATEDHFVRGLRSRPVIVMAVIYLELKASVIVKETMGRKYWEILRSWFEAVMAALKFSSSGEAVSAEHRSELIATIASPTNMLRIYGALVNLMSVSRMQALSERRRRARRYCAGGCPAYTGWQPR
jgi:hypothetical protein